MAQWVAGFFAVNAWLAALSARCNDPEGVNSLVDTDLPPMFWTKESSKILI